MCGLSNILELFLDFVKLTGLRLLPRVWPPRPPGSDTPRSWPSWSLWRLPSAWGPAPRRGSHGVWWPPWTWVEKCHPWKDLFSLIRVRTWLKLYCWNVYYIIIYHFTMQWTSSNAKQQIRSLLFLRNAVHESLRSASGVANNTCAFRLWIAVAKY